MKAKHTNSLIVACIVSIVGLIGFTIANEVGGTYETVGEPYTATYTYCARFAGTGGQSHCADWRVGSERRVNTIVHGWFFETTGYKVVNK